jgi:hypothetical protein
MLPTSQANNHNFYGNMTGPKEKGQIRYGVTFDVLPAGEKTVRLQRLFLKVIAEGEAEAENDHDHPFPPEEQLDAAVAPGERIHSLCLLTSSARSRRKNFLPQVPTK